MELCRINKFALKATHSVVGTVVGMTGKSVLYQSVEKAARKLHYLRLIEWEVAITEDSPGLIEGNHAPRRTTD